MRILVTGGAGFIGSVLVHELLEEGHEITVLDNLTWGIHGLRVSIGKSNFNFVQGDIRNENMVKRLLEGQDAVVHLAALVGSSLCDSNKAEAIEVNVNGSKAICNHLSDDQFLVFASTGSIYGQVEGCCTEATAPNPQSVYAKTKAEAEKVFSNKKNVVILRFATAYGASYRMRVDLLVNQFIYEALEKKQLVIYGKDNIRSVIHVKDLVHGIQFAVRKIELMKGKTFNLSSTTAAFTKEKIAQRIRSKVDCTLQFADSDHSGTGNDYQLSTERIEALGYHSDVTFDEGVGDVVQALSRLKVDKSCFNA